MSKLPLHVVAEGHQEEKVLVGRSVLARCKAHDHVFADISTFTEMGRKLHNKVFGVQTMMC